MEAKSPDIEFFLLIGAAPFGLNRGCATVALIFIHSLSLKIKPKASILRHLQVSTAILTLKYIRQKKAKIPGFRFIRWEGSSFLTGTEDVSWEE